MNMMPMAGSMAPAEPALPPLPPPEEIEKAKQIADAVAWDELEPILRSDQRRMYSVNVETDSTVFEDAETEKAQRLELMGVLTPWMERMIPAIQMNRDLAPLMKELTMFTLDGFKLSRQLEETFEDAFEQIGNMEPQPDPEAQKIQAEMAMKEKELQGNMQLKQAETAMKGKELEQKLAFEQQKFEIEKQKMGMDLQFKQEEMQFKRQQAEQDAIIQRENAAREQQMRDAEFQDKRAMAAHELQSKEREFGLRAKESDAKLRDMDERRASDIATAELERGEKTGKVRKDVDSETVPALQQLANSLDQAFVMVAEAITAMAEQQSATTDTLATMAGYMMAPREIERDPKTNRPIGVKVKADDLKGKLESLLAGRNRVAQETNGLGIEAMQ